MRPIINFLNETRDEFRDDGLEGKITLFAVLLGFAVGFGSIAFVYFFLLFQSPIVMCIITFSSIVVWKAFSKWAGGE